MLLNCTVFIDNYLQMYNQCLIYDNKASIKVRILYLCFFGMTSNSLEKRSEL